VKSKQVNFYSVANDLPEFENYFKNRDIVFVRLPINDKSDFVSKSELYRKNHSNEWSKVYLTKPQYLDSIKVDLIVKQNYYLINDIESPVVEFIRPFRDLLTGTVERSRLYFVSSYFIGNELIPKENDFLKWATDLLGDFKKAFLNKTIENNNYYTNRTLDFVKSGAIEGGLPRFSYFKLNENYTDSK